MPHRKLVQIGDAPKLASQDPKLPTVYQYFQELAQRQGEDICLLKQRAQEIADARARNKSIREESWRLHPLVPPLAAPANNRKSTARAQKPKPTKKKLARKRR